MGIMTLEGVVERNRIRLKDNIRLPQKTTVYVIVPDVQVKQFARIIAPRLARPEQVTNFMMEIVQEPADASL